MNISRPTTACLGLRTDSAVSGTQCKSKTDNCKLLTPSATATIAFTLLACTLGYSIVFNIASTLLAMQTAVIATGCLSVRPSVRHVPDEWRYDRAVHGIRYDSHSSFWRGKVYQDIRRGSPPAKALKWSTALSLAKIWPIIALGHKLETVARLWRKLVVAYELSIGANID